MYYKTFFLMFLFSNSLQTNAQNQWIKQYSAGISTDLYAISMVSESLGWTCGSSGVILNTEDGGKKWTSQKSYETKSLRDIYAINSNLVYAVGDDGLILATIDGGLHWNKRPSPTNDDLTTVYVTADGVYIAGVCGQIFYSNNDGYLWTLQNTNSNRIIYDVQGNPINEICATTSGAEYLKGNASAWIKSIISPNLYNNLLKARYYNNNWYAINHKGNFISLTAVPKILSISNFNSRSMTNVGSTFMVCGDNGVIYTSTDSGSNWIKYTTTLISEDLFDITAVRSGQAWAVGTSGAIYFLNSSNNGNPDVSLIASQTTGSRNTISYVSISVKNFKNMSAGQGTITWDPAIVEYVGIDSTFVSRFDFSFNGLANKSGVRYTFSNNSSTGVTLADNDVIFKIGIKGVGLANSMSAIDFVNVPVILELTDNNNKTINGTYIAGKFTIEGTAQETIKLYYKDTFAIENSQLCVPILVDGFTCMESFQFAIKFDTTLLKFKGINDPKIMHFGNANVNLVGDKLNLIWDNSTSPWQTLSNGSYMFLVCFDVIGKCTTTTKLSFLPLHSALDFSNCNGFLAVNKGEPNIEIRCGVATTTCVIDSAVSISCNGVCDGRAGVTLGGGSGVGFTYVWLRISPAPTGVVSTIQDPTGLCPGEYRLRFRDPSNANAQSQCPLVTIRDVEPLTCTGNTTGVSGVGKSDGRIEVTVTGGTPNYKYAWFRIGNPNLSIGNSNILANLAVNTYIVVVTDAKGCTKRDTFKIDAFVDTIQITGIRMIDSIKCFGECTGALQVDISGGINPYNYRWVGPSGTISTNPARNLCAGLWKVTVTDGKAETDTMSFLMTESVSISISSTQITHEQIGSDGKIELSQAMGGTPPYNYRWSNGSDVKDLINVVGGTYSLTVTDNNKCTKTWSFIIISKKGSALICDPPTVQNSKCSDPCNGSISLNIKGGEVPYNYSAKYGNTQLTGGPDYQNLYSGSYSFTVTDKMGSACSVQSTIINESNQVLTLEKVKCAESNIISNGRYKVNSSGGHSPYTYQWCNNESTATATQLPSGPCSVTVTDNNGCSKSISFEVCVSLASDEIPDLITPNGDGRNDQFILPGSISSLGAIQLTIANRWGDVVYRSDDYKNDWDGREQKSGEDLPPTSYYYVLSQSGKIIQKGIISILR